MKRQCTVNLIIAQPNSGQTEFVLQQLAGSRFIVVTDEVGLEAAIKEQTPEYLFFTTLSGWNENERRYLDLFYSLANMARQKKICIWGELTASDSYELADIQEAVMRVADMKVETEIKEIALGDEQRGIHLLFSAHQYIAAAEKIISVQPKRQYRQERQP